jgi:hypothetical protein
MCKSARLRTKALPKGRPWKHIMTTLSEQFGPVLKSRLRHDDRGYKVRETYAARAGLARISIEARSPVPEEEWLCTPQENMLVLWVLSIDCSAKRLSDEDEGY